MFQVGRVERDRVDAQLRSAVQGRERNGTDETRQKAKHPIVRGGPTGEEATEAQPWEPTEDTRRARVCARASGGLQQHSTPREHARAHTRRPARAHTMRASPRPLCASTRALVATLTAGALLCRTNLHAVGPNASRILSRIASACAARNGTCRTVCVVLHAASCMLHALLSAFWSVYCAAEPRSKSHASDEPRNAPNPTSTADGWAGGWNGPSFHSDAGFVLFLGNHLRRLGRPGRAHALAPSCHSGRHTAARRICGECDGQADCDCAKCVRAREGNGGRRRRGREAGGVHTRVVASQSDPYPTRIPTPTLVPLPRERGTVRAFMAGGIDAARRHT